MKQTTLEDLYYGNINPCEITFVRGSEYGKCFDKVTELSKSVCSQLTEEYINKMNELESAYPHDLPLKKVYPEYAVGIHAAAYSGLCSIIGQKYLVLSVELTKVLPLFKKPYIR